MASLYQTYQSPKKDVCSFPTGYIFTCNTSVSVFIVQYTEHEKKKNFSIVSAVSTDIWTQILNILHLYQHTTDLFSGKR